MKRLFITFFMLLMALPATQTFADDDALVVYSGRSDKFVKPIVKKFTEETGIEVKLYTAPAASLLNKLLIEKDKTPADIFISNDAGTLQVGEDKGLFKTLPDDLVAPVEKKYRSKHNQWVGLSGRARLIVVNKNAKNIDSIQSIRDLADPKFKDKLAITTSANGSFIAGVTVYAKTMGEDKTSAWLKGIKENNGGQLFNKHSRIVSAVANGEFDVGLINHYYYFRHMNKYPDAPIKMIVPDKNGMGVAWNVAGLAVSKYTKRQDNAEKFVEFLVSKEGQALFASMNKEFPTRADIKLTGGLQDLGKIKVADVPLSTLGKERSATLDLIERSGLQ